MARILTQETSLSRKRISLMRESGWLGRLVPFEFGLAGLCLLAGIYVFVKNQSATWLWIAVITGALAAGHWLRIRQNKREAKHLEYGLRGEREVTRLLDGALDNTHYLMNDLMIRRGHQTAQIDHLVISPRGIFVIETKNWGGHLEGDENEDTWTQKLKPELPPRSRFNPIRQVRRQVEFIADRLKKAGLDWPDVRGLVVIHSPQATWYVHNATMELLKPEEAVQAIARYQSARTYSEAEVTGAVNLFMRG